MKKIILFITFTASYIFGFGQTIGTGQLQITINKTSNGVSISSIKDGDTEILNTSITNELFSIDVRDLINSNLTTISSIDNWETSNVVLSKENTQCTILFSNPTLSGVPSSLIVMVTVNTNEKQSQWHISVSGVGDNHSLMEAYFPHFNILGEDGEFLIPKYSGQEVKSPAINGIDYVGSYPRGNATNMQFMAYYGGESDVYFGFHDPTASYKVLYAQSQSLGVNIECKIAMPDKTLAGNDWEFPGQFELDLFNGDWYDAALIYKKWVSENADYWPIMTPERVLRQNEIGNIGIWFNDVGYYNGKARTADAIEKGTQICIDEMPKGVHIATHLYTWYGFSMDNNYPEIFPPITGLNSSISTLQSNGATIMPYFNGYLYDVDLASFNGTGLPNASKNEDGNYFSQHYNSDGVKQYFAVMCPNTSIWQDILNSTAVNFTSSDPANDNAMGATGIYFDQVSAAVAQQCMDPTHGHTLGGGSYWRDGYKKAFNEVHANTPANSFITVEGACDYLLDEVDGCLVDPWDRANIVPAYTAVYSGRVQLFGTRVGTNYSSDAFYTQLAKHFSFGIQPGRLTTWIMNPANSNSQAEAKPFARRLGTMRYKMRGFMAFGEMKRPPVVNPISTIPTITSDWDDGGGTRMVTISALQSSLWQNEDSIAFVFVNASRTTTLQFAFNIKGEDYGLSGNLKIREVTESDDGSFEIINNISTQTVELSPLEIKAYVIKSGNTTGIKDVNVKKDDVKVHINPNPTNGRINIQSTEKIVGVEVYNLLGKQLLKKQIHATHAQLNLDALPKGIYTVHILLKKGSLTKKIMFK